MKRVSHESTLLHSLNTFYVKIYKIFECSRLKRTSLLIKYVVHFSSSLYLPWTYSFCHCCMSSLGSPDLMANRFAIMVLNPGARQDWAMKPSLSSARQMTSSPCFQSQLGMFSRYAWDTIRFTIHIQRL